MTHLASVLLALYSTLGTLSVETLEVPVQTQEAGEEKNSVSQKSAESPILRMAKNLTAQAASLRGLPPLKPIQQAVTTKSKISGYIRTRIEKTDMAVQMAYFGVAAKLMGATDMPPNLLEILTKVLVNQVAGYYDWEKKTLFVASWLPSELQAPTLLHEVTHALQDQHFNLGRFMDPEEGYSDATSGAQSLFEGDATLLMMLAMLPAVPEKVSPMTDRLNKVLSTPESQQELEDLPRLFRDSFMFPYAQGLSFTAALYDVGGWEQVNKAYAAPPLSTEQILHPEKYLASPKDNPLGVTMTLPKSLRKIGFDLVYSDGLGEEGIRSLSSYALNSENAAKAADGWGGDRYYLLENKGKEYMVFWICEWDSEAEADEYHALHAPQSRENNEPGLKGKTQIPVSEVHQKVGKWTLRWWGPTAQREEMARLSAKLLKNKQMHSTPLHSHLDVEKFRKTLTPVKRK